MGDASEKDEFIAPLSDAHLKRKVLIVESIAAHTLERTQLIISNQVVEFTLQGLLSFVFDVLLQPAEEVYEVDLNEGVQEGKELRGGDFSGLIQEVRKGLLCVLILLRNIRKL